MQYGMGDEFNCHENRACRGPREPRQHGPIQQQPGSQLEAGRERNNAPSDEGDGQRSRERCTERLAVRLPERFDWLQSVAELGRRTIGDIIANCHSRLFHTITHPTACGKAPLRVHTSRSF